MVTANPYRKYQETQVETVNPGKLVLFLYDGALKFMEEARGALAKKNFEAANGYLIRAQDIVAELIASLNFEVSEIAGNLFRLYEYAHYQLVQANVRKETAPLLEAKKIIAALRDAWREACLASPAGEVTGAERRG